MEIKTMSNVTQILKDIIAEKAISASELGRLINRSRALMSRWLSGERRPAPTDLLSLVETLSVSSEMREKLWSARFPSLAAELGDLALYERIEFFEAAAIASRDI